LAHGHLPCYEIIVIDKAQTTRARVFAGKEALPGAHRASRSSELPSSLTAWSLETGAQLPSDAVERCASQMLSTEDALRTLLPLPREQVPDWDRSLKSPNRAFYETNALAFNQAFFRKNLLKCLIALSRTSLRGTTGYVGADLGCGAGPMTLAALISTQPTHFLMVDASAAQLRLARRILAQFDSGRYLSLFQAAIPTHLRLSTDILAMASYWASETKSDEVNVGDLLMVHKLFLVVDDPEYIINLRQLMPPEAVLETDHVQFKVSGPLEALIEGGGGRFGYIFGRGFSARRQIL